jgi:hypothetical protein
VWGCVGVCSFAKVEVVSEEHCCEETEESLNPQRR